MPETRAEGPTGNATDPPTIEPDSETITTTVVETEIETEMGTIRLRVERLMKRSEAETTIGYRVKQNGRTIVGVEWSEATERLIETVVALATRQKIKP